MSELLPMGKSEGCGARDAAGMQQAAISSYLEKGLPFSK